MNASITLDLKIFLDLLTYDGLFDYVTLDTSIGAIISQADPEKKVAYVEPLNAYKCTVWYPVESWICECKRRAAFEQALVKARQEIAARPKVFIEEQQTKDKEELQRLIIAAATAGNTTEFNKLMERMKNK